MWVMLLLAIFIFFLLYWPKLRIVEHIDQSDLTKEITKQGNIARVPVKMKLLVKNPWELGGLMCMTDTGYFRKAAKGYENCTDITLSMDSDGKTRFVHPKLGYLTETKDTWQTPQQYNEHTDMSPAADAFNQFRSRFKPLKGVYSLKWDNDTKNPPPMFVSSVDGRCMYFKILTSSGKALTVMSNAYLGGNAPAKSAWLPGDEGSHLACTTETGDEPVRTAQNFFPLLEGAPKNGQDNPQLKTWLNCQGLAEPV